MAIDSDNMISLPTPPPPRPAARRAAIDAAIRKFDGIEEHSRRASSSQAAIADSVGDHASAPGWRAGDRCPDRDCLHSGRADHAARSPIGRDPADGEPNKSNQVGCLPLRRAGLRGPGGFRNRRKPDPMRQVVAAAPPSLAQPSVSPPIVAEDRRGDVGRERPESGTGSPGACRGRRAPAPPPPPPPAPRSRRLPGTTILS